MCIAAIGWIGYTVFTSDIGSLFDKQGNLASVGLLGTLGVLIYVVVFIAIGILIAYTCVFVIINKRYTFTAKVYAGQSSTVMHLNKKSKSGIIWMIVSLVLGCIVFGLAALVFGINNIVTLLLIIPVAILIISAFFAILDYNSGKKLYNSLSEEQKAEAQKLSEQLKVNYKKAKTFKSVGKLY